MLGNNRHNENKKTQSIIEEYNVEILKLEKKLRPLSKSTDK
jgi:hypothetical protein